MTDTTNYWTLSFDPVPNNFVYIGRGEFMDLDAL